MRLTTPRLVLREYRPDDYEAIREYDADPQVQRYRGAVTITEQQTRDYLQAMIGWAAERPRARYMLAVCLPADDRVIGWLPLRLTRPELREAEIGWTVGRRHWGRGYATEAAQAMLGFAFAELGLHRVVAYCRAENRASWRVMEKLGMRREGHLREADWGNGVWEDLYLYAILGREFPRR